MTVELRQPALIALVLIALALIAAVAGGGDARMRLDRALARTDSLQTVSFDMRGSVRAEGQQAAAGSIEQDVIANGAIAFPDRLHFVAYVEGAARELLVVGERTWTRLGDEWTLSPTTRRTATNDPRSLLAIIAGPGNASFAGYGFDGGALTYHVRIELDAAALRGRLERRGEPVPGLAGEGRIEVALGVFDDRIYRQRVDIVETAGSESAGPGLYRVRTRYVVDYFAFDEPVEIREPR